MNFLLVCKKEAMDIVSLLKGKMNGTLDPTTCVDCGNKIDLTKFGSLALREHKICPRCAKCMDSAFVPMFCTKCKIVYKMSEYDEKCKKCNAPDLTYMRRCHCCEELLLWEGNEQVYGPKKCSENDEHIV